MLTEQPSPSGMRRGDGLTIRRAHQYREAVCNHDGTSHARPAGHRGIGLRYSRYFTGRLVQVHQMPPVNLVHENRFDSQQGGKPLSVEAHILHPIADMQTQIHRVERRL